MFYLESASVIYGQFTLNAAAAGPSVENRRIYDNRKEQKIERLKESISLAGNDSVRYEIYNKLFREYFNYQTDSALHYVSLKENLAKAKHWDYEDELRMNRSELFSTMGMYKKAIDMLKKLIQRNCQQVSCDIIIPCGIHYTD